MHLKNKLLTIGISVVGALALAQNTFAQRTWSSGSYVPISINSGNPAFPYPQFLEYAKGKTLAKYNAEGVTHADMEKAGREAYEIMSHRCRYEGGTHCGVPYITYNDFVKLGMDEMPQGGAEFCSEGDGYILLAAAIFADQPTFNGLWMWIHDNRLSKVKKYSDGEWLRKGFEVDGRLVCKDPEASGGLAGWNCFDDAPVGDGSTHSASDGDYDIAMALLIAYKQWGEFMYHNGKQVIGGDGNPISYKQAAYDFITALVDTVPYYNSNAGQVIGGQLNDGFSGYLSGDIGIDGYPKGGNSWGEVTNWRANQTLFDPKLSIIPSMGGGGGQATYVDYNAPSYFNEFAQWLEGDGKGSEWQINQFKRAEASSDWVAGQLYAQGGLASTGKYQVMDDNTVQFTPFNSGEDFRFAWRHILNYLWHGNPETTWDPASHTVKAGGNTFEHDLAIRHATFMKEPADMLGGDRICGKLGASPDGGQCEWFGPAHIQQSYFMDGSCQMKAGSNYALGCAAPSVVALGDEELLGDMYRQSELVWDDASAESKNLTDNERYIESMPKYFHGWFRCLGLLTNSGNLHAPSNMVPQANTKVYMSVDKTYAYVGDDVTYGVQYRNYGTLDAEGVSITTKLDPNYEFVSATKNGTYNAGNHSITWKIGEIPGFKSGKLEATMDSVFFTVNVKDTLNKRICLTSTITGSNFEDWVSNEFPNRATYTMERNCVDILANRSLSIKKTANRNAMNPADVVKFTVEFENKSEGEASWLNGGRDNVRLSYGNYLPNGDDEGDWSNTTFYQYYRFWHDAPEAYINMGNYRVSYFMNDINKGFYGEDNPNGWQFYLDNKNDVEKYGYFPETGGAEILFQKIPAGEDDRGAWNQRFIVKFPDVLCAASTHVFDKLDSKYLCHKGVFGPGLYRTALKTFNATNMKFKVADDWSYSKDAVNNSSGDNLSGQTCQFIPITPGWYVPEKYGEEITNYARHACSPEQKGFDRVLVEEFDGYTWRRIQGTGPLPGKEAYDVVVIDTIPLELEWDGFVTDKALGVTATYTPAPAGAGFTGIVKWTVPEMLVGEKGKLVYTAVAKDIGCSKTPQPEDKEFKNVAWISSKTDSPDSSQVDLLISCNELPPVIDPQTSLFKEANKEKADQGDNVTYTVYFKNTEGTIIDGDLSDASAWKALGNGNVPKANGEMSTDMNKNQGIAPPYFFTDKKAYGKDVTLQTQWNGGNESAIYFVLRYQSGTPYEPDFKGICVKFMPLSGGKYCKFEILDGTTVVATDKTNKACPAKDDGTFNPIDLKLAIKEDKIYAYINDMETVLATYKGLSTSKAGYAGIYSGPQGNQQTLSAFHAEVDHAFDVTLFDQLPEELGNITDISDNGTYDEAKHLIAWPTVATTPETSLAPGDSIGYTFTADVVSCNNYINNMGLATVYGLDTLKVLNTIECGAATCELEDAVATFGKDSAFCKGDTITFKVKLTDAKGKAIKGSFFYEFYLGTDVVSAKDNKADSLLITEPGDYKVIVYSTTDPACLVESEPVAIGMDTLPLTTLADTSACSGTGASIVLKATEKDKDTYTYEWGDGSNTFSLTAAEDGEYTVAVTNGACVARDTANVKFGSVILKDGIFTLNGKDYPRTNAVDTGYVCLDKENTLSVNYESDNGTFSWSADPTDASLTSTTNSTTISPKVTTTYYVDFVKGCDARDSFVVVIAEPMEVTVKVDTLCNSLQLTASTTGSTKPTFTWTKDGEESTDNPIEISGLQDPSGSVSVIATAADACQSEPVEVTYENVDLDVLVDGSASVCPGKSTELTASVTSKGLANPTYTYSWTDATGTEVAATESATLPAGKYTLTVTDGICTKTAEHEIVNGTGEVKGDLTINGKKIIGSGRDRAYGSCGGELEIVADYTHDAGTDFSWTVNGQPLTDKANTITISPAQDTKVVVEFMNECAAIDSFFINMLDSVKMDTAQTRKCGETTLTATSALPGVTYTWTDGTTAIGTGKTFNATLAGYPTASGTAYVQGTADGYCDSRLMEVPFVIDTLGVSLDGPASVCPDATATLKAVATTSHSGMKVTYAYGQRKAGSNAAFAPIAGTGETTTSPALTEDTEFEVTATAGDCVAKATFSVKIGTPSRDGNLTADGIVADQKNAAGTKRLRTCGGVPVKLAVTHTASDESSFAWTKDGAAAGNGRELTIEPSTAKQHTEQYIVTYVNECEVSDTIDVEVYPLDATADLSTLNATYCEGESATAKLEITGYDPKLPGSYIKWTKDGSEAGAEATLAFASLKPEDSGTYSYEVSNGICTIPGATGTKPEATLKVNPKATIAAENAVVIATRGEDQVLSVTTTPAGATVTWMENGAAVGTGNPFTLAKVDASHTLTAVATAADYCADSTTISVKVDAKPVVKLTTDATAVCEGEAVTLTADTTGTGELLNPADYKLAFYAVAANGTRTQVGDGGNKPTQPALPAATTSYIAVVTYNGQTAESDPVEVEVFPTPSVSIDYQKTICFGESAEVTLAVTPATATVEWKSDPTLAASGTTATATPEKTTTYGFAISQNGGLCTQSHTFSVAVTAPVKMEPLEPKTICEGASVSFVATVAEGRPSGYKWLEQGGSETLSADQRLNATPTATTTYLLVAENGACKADTQKVEVEVAQNPVIEDVVTVAVKDVQVVVSGGLDPYKFSVDGGEFADNDIITLRNFGAHKYKVVDLNGCTAEITDTLPAPEINIPVVITPNHDGVNDEFEVPGLAESYPDATIRIYDRWGKKLVEYEAKDGSWDGTYNGKKMPSTDYWYEIYIPELYKYFTGHFTLIND